MPGSKFLCIGLCCVDIVNEVPTYPKEDTDQRSSSQRKQRGGNASNSTTVLSLLGEQPHYFGALADSCDLNFIRQDFNKYGVDSSSAVVRKGYDCLISYVILAQDTGSRTIIHVNPGIPDVRLNEFETIDLRQFSWIHFEGMNIEEVPKMVKHVRKFCSENDAKITISIELEKENRNLESLIPFADVLFISKDFALSMGWHKMEDAVAGVYDKFSPRGITICPWGEMGAAAKKDEASPVCVSGTFPPAKIVDSLGAGDTFISGTIYALNKGRCLQESIEIGCKIAGAKIGQIGWNLGLKDIFLNSINS